MLLSNLGELSTSRDGGYLGGEQVEPGVVSGSVNLRAVARRTVFRPLHLLMGSRSVSVPISKERHVRYSLRP